MSLDRQPIVGYAGLMADSEDSKSFKGVVKGGGVVLESGVSLPEGTPVVVTVQDIEIGSPHRPRRRGRASSRQRRRRDGSASGDRERQEAGAVRVAPRLIAATAEVLGAILVTSDSDFSRLPTLEIESWASGGPAP